MTSTYTHFVVASAIALYASLGVVQGARAQTDLEMKERQAVAAPAIAGECITNKTTFVTRSAIETTTSIAFVPMPYTRRDITLSAKGCIIVDFAGEVAAVANNRMLIRAFVNKGVGVSEPPFVRMEYPVSPGNFAAHSMRFVFKNVPAGTYNVRIDWQSENGGVVGTENRTLTIQYR